MIATIFAWWFSTGLILLLVRLNRAWHMPLLIGFAAFAGVAVWGLLDSADNPSVAGIYCGFLCVLVIWGWHEASFLMGKITGPRPKACPEGVMGWRRFGYATATLIYHEIALFITLIVIAMLMWNAPNQIGLWVFTTLFLMRLSAKFNIFLGVPNLTEEFFPLHLEHLKSYLPKRPMNWLMPISLFLSAALIVWLWRLLGNDALNDAQQTALVILITLIGLGMLEHVFMITPLPDAALWRWAVPARATQKQQASDPGSPLKKPENA